MILPSPSSAMSLSVVIPVFNERDNIGPLVHEVVKHLRDRVAPLSSWWPFAAAALACGPVVWVSLHLLPWL